MSIRLPIERIQNSSGQAQYRWYQTASTIIGPRKVEHTGPVPSTMVQAIEELITVATVQALEITNLKRTIERLEKELTKKEEIANIPKKADKTDRVDSPSLKTKRT